MMEEDIETKIKNMKIDEIIKKKEESNGHKPIEIDNEVSDQKVDEKSNEVKERKKEDLKVKKSEKEKKRKSRDKTNSKHKNKEVSRMLS